MAEHGIIEQIQHEFNVRRNRRWFKKNRAVIHDKYDGLWILIYKCRVVATARTLSGLADYSYAYKDGCIVYEVPIKAEHIFGCTIEELIKRRV